MPGDTPEAAFSSAKFSDFHSNKLIRQDMLCDLLCSKSFFASLLKEFENQQSGLVLENKAVIQSA